MQRSQGTRSPQLGTLKFGTAKSKSAGTEGYSPHTTGINVDTCAGVAHCETASTAAETSAGR